MKPLDEVRQVEDANFASRKNCRNQTQRAHAYSEGKPVPQTAVRIFGSLRRLRGNTVYQGSHQLFGDRMLIANATGCSSIYGSNAPTVPYTSNSKGRGPAWASSLFEDNAEYGYGFFLGVAQQRDRLVTLVQKALEQELPEALRQEFQNWLEVKDQGEASLEAADRIAPLLEKAVKEAKGEARELLEQILEGVDLLPKR